MKERMEKLEDKVSKHESEINLLRKFKHDTNGHLQNHNGKLNIIEIQQNSMVNGIDKLTLVVEDAIKKISNLMTIKSMVIGAGIVFVPTVTGMFFLFQWYLKSKGMG